MDTLIYVLLSILGPELTEMGYSRKNLLNLESNELQRLITMAMDKLNLSVEKGQISLNNYLNKVSQMSGAISSSPAHSVRTLSSKFNTELAKAQRELMNKMPDYSKQISKLKELALNESNLAEQAITSAQKLETTRSSFANRVSQVGDIFRKDKEAVYQNQVDSEHKRAAHHQSLANAYLAEADRLQKQQNQEIDKVNPEAVETRFKQNYFKENKL